MSTFVGEGGKPIPNVLDEPLHGIYIPTLLTVVGISFLTYLSGDLRLLYGLVILAAFLGVRTLRAYNRRQSLFTDKWSSLELEDQTIISRNTAIYRFKLRTNLETLDIPACHHVAVKVPIDGKDEIRFYNPISSNLEMGYMDLIVKSYPEGVVSKYFAGLRSGSTVDFMGPIGTFRYSPNSSKAIGFIAGGTGITPALQLLNEIITVPEDLTTLSLFYVNDTENDILLRDELDEMAEKYPNFKVFYVLREPKDLASWNGGVGLLTKEEMARNLPSPTDDNRLLICGPDGLERMALEYAKELGWRHTGFKSTDGDDQVFVF